MKYGPLVDEFTLCVTCPKWCSAPKKGEKINASTNSAEFFLLRAELKYEKLLPFLVNRGDLLSSGTASEAFSFYNPLKWALLFSRNRSNSGVKKKRKRVGAWPSQLQYFVCLTLLLHLTHCSEPSIVVQKLEENFAFYIETERLSNFWPNTS